MEDAFHGYIPNDSYQTEADGEYPKVLNQSYSDVIPDSPKTAYPNYNGDGPTLKRNINNK